MYRLEKPGNRFALVLRNEEDITGKCELGADHFRFRTAGVDHAGHTTVPCLTP